MKFFQKIPSLIERIEFLRGRDLSKIAFLSMNIGLGIIIFTMFYAIYVQLFSMFRLPWIYVSCLFGGFATILFSRYKMLCVIDTLVTKQYSFGLHKILARDAIGYMIGAAVLEIFFFAMPGNHLDMILTIVASIFNIVGSIMFLPTFSPLRGNAGISSLKQISLYNVTKRYIDIIRV